MNMNDNNLCPTPDFYCDTMAIYHELVQLNQVPPDAAAILATDFVKQLKEPAPIIVDNEVLSPSEFPPVMSGVTLAKIIKKRPETVYRWCESGRLRATDERSPGAKRARWRILREDAEAFLRASRTPQPARRARRRGDGSERY